MDEKINLEKKSILELEVLTYKKVWLFSFIRIDFTTFKFSILLQYIDNASDFLLFR